MTTKSEDMFKVVGEVIMDALTYEGSEDSSDKDVLDLKLSAVMKGLAYLKQYPPDFDTMASMPAAVAEKIAGYTKKLKY